MPSHRACHGFIGVGATDRPIEGPQFFVQSFDCCRCQTGGCGIPLRCNGGFAPGTRPAPQSFETRTRLQEYPPDRDITVEAEEIIFGRQFQQSPLVMRSLDFKGRHRFCLPLLGCVRVGHSVLGACLVKPGAFSVVRAFLRISWLGGDGLVCGWRRWLLQLFFSLGAKLDHLDGLSAALRNEGSWYFRHGNMVKCVIRLEIRLIDSHAGAKRQRQSQCPLDEEKNISKVINGIEE